jgi:glycerate dehydrogenase
MERIVIPERGSVDAEFRRPSFAHEWVEYAETEQGQLVERARGATVLIANKLSVGEAELAGLPGLRLIAVAATGVDRVDLAACGRRGVAVANVRGYAVHSVAEHVLMLALALRRNLLAYVEDVRRGLWAESKQFCLLTHPIRDLHESTLGVVGYGSLGRATAELARRFGMRVLVGERKGADSVREGRIEFDALLGESDVVTLHAPLNGETRHLVGERELRLMKRGALLINCSGKGGSPGPAWTCSATSRRAKATRCSPQTCRTSSSRRTSPGPAAARCRRSPIRSSTTSKPSSGANPRI